VGRAKARDSIVGRHAGTGAMKVIGNQVPGTASASPWCSENGRGRRRLHATALLPLNRIVVRDLGVHPRGEFRTSGAAVGQIKYMGRVSGLSFSNAEDLSEQRGWAPRSPPRDAQVYEATAKPSPRGQRRAMGEVRGAKECPARKPSARASVIHDGPKKHGPRAHAEGHDGRPWVRWPEPHQNAARRSRRGVIADEGGIDPGARDGRHPAVGSVIGDSVVPTDFRPGGTRDLSCVGAPTTDIGGFLKTSVYF
jgi:hypothetical protein